MGSSLTILLLYIAGPANDLTQCTTAFCTFQQEPNEQKGAWTRAKTERADLDV
jgi:hypothetical protein